MGNRSKRNTKQNMKNSKIIKITWEKIDPKVTNINKKKKGVNIWGYLPLEKLPKWARRMSKESLRYIV